MMHAHQILSTCASSHTHSADFIFRFIAPVLEVLLLRHVTITTVFVSLDIEIDRFRKDSFWGSISPKGDVVELGDGIAGWEEVGVVVRGCFVGASSSVPPSFIFSGVFLLFIVAAIAWRCCFAAAMLRLSPLMYIQHCLQKASPPSLTCTPMRLRSVHHYRPTPIDILWRVVYHFLHPYRPGY